jgi:hypothetical protein
VRRLLSEQFKVMSDAVKADLDKCRRVILTMDCWSKRGLTGSYLAISASFFNPASHKPIHVLLNLHNIAHPHTGQMLADKVNDTLTQWNISAAKVLAIITDNGSNMIKAINTLRTSHQNAVAPQAGQDDADLSSFSSDAETETDAEGGDQANSSSENDEMNADGINLTNSEQHLDEDEMNLPETVLLPRLPCLAHTLQLVVKSIDKIDSYCNLIVKARRVVRIVKISSKATELLISKCGLTLVTDCTTRWNSQYMMIERLLAVKVALKEVLEELQLDSPLLHGDWTLAEQIMQVLKPFKQQTDILQTNTVSMSQILPSLLELKLALKDPAFPKKIVQTLSESLTARFSCFLDPSSPSFNPIPAAACFLDPSFAPCMFRDDMSAVLSAAKAYIRLKVWQHCLSSIFMCIYIL